MTGALTGGAEDQADGHEQGAFHQDWMRVTARCIDGTVRRMEPIRKEIAGCYRISALRIHPGHWMKSPFEKTMSAS